jgi:glycosyltransferase involved in cell wall biosynthesis
LAELKDIHGEINFDIYGEIYNKEYWQECEKIIDKLPKNIKVNYKGTVPAEQVGSTIQNYHALFMPTRGENFGHVILESLSAGRPVLISDQTPWHDLEDKSAGWDISLKSSIEWTDNLNELSVMENDEYQKWSRGARKLAEEYVNSPELLEGYRGIFDV